MEKFFLKARKPALIDLKENNSTWVELDMVGKWDGYMRNGKPETIETTPEILDQIIDNFNKETNSKPVYLSHADLYEADPPAIGWIRELKYENKRLLGFIEFNNDIANKIRKGAWKYVSVLLFGDYINPKTGENDGWYLWSLAVTNQPFIDGLKPIALSKNSLDKEKSLVYLSKKEESNIMSEVGKENVAKELSPDVAALSPEECALKLDEMVLLMREVAGDELSLEDLMKLLTDKKDALKAALLEDVDSTAGDDGAMESMGLSIQALKEELKELKSKNDAMEKTLSTYQSKEIDVLLEKYDLSAKSKEMWKKSALANREMFNEQIKDLPLKAKEKVNTEEFNFEIQQTEETKSASPFYKEIMAFSKFGKKK